MKARSFQCVASPLFRLITPMLCLISLAAALSAEPIPVRYVQGSTRAFLSLKTLDGAPLATGEITQTVHGVRVTSRLVFRFRDGSIDDDLTVFTQRGTFRLISDHHIQHGPSFPKPMDVMLDGVSGNITMHLDDGKVREEHMDLPLDVANGLPPNLLLNLLPSTPETKVSYVAAGSKPRLVHLSIKPQGEVAFTVGGLRRKATDFIVHIELGGVAGVVAPILGKQPSDYHIWIVQGVPPAFLREEGALYEGGPIWRIEQMTATLGR